MKCFEFHKLFCKRSPNLQFEMVRITVLEWSITYLGLKKLRTEGVRSLASKITLSQTLVTLQLYVHNVCKIMFRLHANSAKNDTLFFKKWPYIWNKLHSDNYQCFHFKFTCMWFSILELTITYNVLHICAYMYQFPSCNDNLLSYITTFIIWRFCKNHNFVGVFKI